MADLHAEQRQESLVHNLYNENQTTLMYKKRHDPQDENREPTDSEKLQSSNDGIDIRRAIIEELDDKKHYDKIKEIRDYDEFPQPDDGKRNKLHDKYYVQLEMAQFQDDQKELNFELERPCICCSRYWFHNGPY